MFMLIVAALPFAVKASGNHHHHSDETTVNNYTTINNPTNVVKETTKEDAQGIASAIAASQHHFDASTLKTQVSIAIGSFEDEEAASIAVGKSVNNFLISGSVSLESDKRAYGGSIGFKF